MDFNSEEFKLEMSFKPSPVVESRWKEKKYTPEVQFNGKQYVVAAPCSTYDAAMEAARAKVDEMKKAMLATGMQLVAGLPLAKE